jgi:hypothetical protein
MIYSVAINHHHHHHHPLSLTLARLLLADRRRASVSDAGDQFFLGGWMQSGRVS